MYSITWNMTQMFALARTTFNRIFRENTLFNGTGIDMFLFVILKYVQPKPPSLSFTFNVLRLLNCSVLVPNHSQGLNKSLIEFKEQFFKTKRAMPKLTFSVRIFLLRDEWLSWIISLFLYIVIPSWSVAIVFR